MLKLKLPSAIKTSLNSDIRQSNEVVAKHFLVSLIILSMKNCLVSRSFSQTIFTHGNTAITFSLYFFHYAKFIASFPKNLLFSFKLPTLLSKAAINMKKEIWFWKIEMSKKMVENFSNEIKQNWLRYCVELSAIFSNLQFLLI